MAQLPSVVLKDPSSALTATFVPSAGMVCTSLSDGGVELLGQRRGLRAYLTTGKTMGIPILYPWANRLSANGYAVDGGAVTLTPGVGGVRSDEHGLVIHGVLAAYPGWLVTEQERAGYPTVLDYGGQPAPAISLRSARGPPWISPLVSRALSIETTSDPRRHGGVSPRWRIPPVSDHIPDLAALRWLGDPALRHLPVGGFGQETPASRATRIAPDGPRLSDKTFDDGFDPAKFRRDRRLRSQAEPPHRSGL